MLPRNYTKVKVIVESISKLSNEQIANRDSKLKYNSIRKATGKIKTHAQVQGSDFSDSARR